jgi:osmotically-inducible protein OsmY
MRYATTIVLTTLLTSFILTGCAPAIIGGVTVGAGAIHDRRSTGAVIDDQTIELKALTRLFNDDQVSANTHINVTSYNGIVLLTGEAPSEPLRNKAVSLVRTIPKVRKIHNEINLSAPSAMIARSSDSYITSKVKVSLLGIQNIRGFDPTRVKVVTEDGTVYLMGLLWPAEEQAVVERIRRIGGVQRVVKLFEYID